MEINELPDELLIEGIFPFLEPHEVLLSCAPVCRRWNDMSHDDALWRRFALQTDPRVTMEDDDASWLEVYRRLVGTSREGPKMEGVCGPAISWARAHPGG